MTDFTFLPSGYDGDWKICVSYPVATFCNACGFPVHQDTPAGWNPATTPAVMLCRNPACAENGRRFEFAATKTAHAWMK